MEELLSFVEERIKELGKRESVTIDENGKRIMDCDAESFYHDGLNDGLFSAYVLIKNKIKIINQRNNISIM